MRLTPCECPAAGWCERHLVYKSSPAFQLCRRNRDVFAGWEVAAAERRAAEPGSALEGPSLARRGWNLGVAAVRHAADGLRKVEPEEFEQRLATCAACPLCDVPNMVCREVRCGCQLRTKAGWASEQCPLGKWPETDTADHTTSVSTPDSP